MKVLFLDVDGVLNSEASARQIHWEAKRASTVDKVNVFGFNPVETHNFRTLMSEIPDMKIVISSCWRSGRTHEQCIELLNENNLDGSRCIGRTGLYLDNRGMEIQEWLDCHPDVLKFVILDDDSDMAHLTPYLVKTSFRVGLTLLHNEEIKKRFAE